MKTFFKKIQKVIQAVCVISNLILLIICIGITMKVTGQTFEAVYPIPIIIVAALFTIFTFLEKTTFLMAFAGLILYASSWTIAEKFGIWPGIIIWLIGFCIWLLAAAQSIKNTFLNVTMHNHCHKEF
jgi:hypothetical protein